MYTIAWVVFWLVLTAAIGYFLYTEKRHTMAFVASGVALLVAAAIRPVYVSPYETALVIGPSGIEGTPFSGKLVFLPFWKNTVTFGHRPVVINQRKADGTGISAQTGENSPVVVDATVQYNVDFSHLGSFYTRYGSDKETLGIFIKPILREAVRNVIGHYKNADIASQRVKIAQEVEQAITEKLKTALPYVVVESVSVRNIHLPDELVAASQAVATQEQQNKQKELEVQMAKLEAQRKVAEAEGNANSLRAQAQGEADAQRIRATGAAKAQVIQAEAQAKALETLAEAQRKYNSTVQGLCSDKMSPEQCTNVLMSYFRYQSELVKWQSIAAAAETNPEALGRIFKYYEFNGLSAPNGGMNLYNFPPSLFGDNSPNIPVPTPLPVPQSNKGK